ncbi:hypothetical protein ACWATR_04840 [Nostoc sp. UIC 10890]
MFSHPCLQFGKTVDTPYIYLIKISAIAIVSSVVADMKKAVIAGGRRLQ